MSGLGFWVQARAGPGFWLWVFLVLVFGLIRLLPSRVGFAERDASRPAFGGSSLVNRTRHTCVGGGPIGGALSVRVSVRVLRSRSRQTIPAHRPKEGTNDHEPSAASECAGARVVSSISLRSRLEMMRTERARACCGGTEGRRPEREERSNALLRSEATSWLLRTEDTGSRARVEPAAERNDANREGESLLRRNRRPKA